MTAAEEDEKTKVAVAKKKRAAGSRLLTLDLTRSLSTVYSGVGMDVNWRISTSRKKNNSVTSDTQVDSLCEHAQPVRLNPPL